MWLPLPATLCDVAARQAQRQARQAQRAVGWLDGASPVVVSSVELLAPRTYAAVLQ